MNARRRRPIDVLRSHVLQCTYGHYPWDDWKKKALEKGVPEKLADLGRAVMREAFQHDWPENLKSLCGWHDEGLCMIRIALRSPKTAEKRWQRLLETDGLRGEWKDGQWVPNY
jgi:hypothetical protein